MCRKADRLTHTHTHTHTYTHTHPPPLNLSMAGHWARSWYTNFFCQLADLLTRLLNDEMLLRLVLHMLTVVGISEPASLAGFLAFSGGDQTTATAYGAAVLLPVIHLFLPVCQHFSSCPITSPQQSLAGTSFGMHEVS